MDTIFENFNTLDGDTKFLVASAVWGGFMAIVGLISLLVAKLFGGPASFSPGERRRVRGSGLTFQVVGPDCDSYTPVRFDDGVVNIVKTSWIQTATTRAEVM